MTEIIIPKPIHDDLFNLMCTVDKKRTESGSFTQQDERKFWIKSVTDNGDLLLIQTKHSISYEDTKRFFVAVAIEYEKTRKWWYEFKKRTIYFVTIFLVVGSYEYFVSRV